MASKFWAVFLSPISLVNVEADSVEEQGTTLVFKKDGATCAKFQAWQAYGEHACLNSEDKKRASVTPLRAVEDPKSQPDTPAPEPQVPA